MTENEKMLDLIGKWKFPSSKFFCEKDVTFKQTNVMGNTYFSNYVEWQGEAREKLFLSHPAAPAFLLKNPNIFLVTHSLFHKFIINTFFGDKIRIEITTKDILDYSLTMIFRYWNARSKVLVGQGWQKVCFWDHATSKPCKVPQIFLDLAMPIREGQNPAA